MTCDPVHGVLVFLAQCQGGCVGTATLHPTTGGRSASTAAARRALSFTFSVSAGRHSRAFRVRLRAALRSARRATLVVTLRDRRSHKVSQFRRGLLGR